MSVLGQPAGPGAGESPDDRHHPAMDGVPHDRGGEDLSRAAV